MSKATCMVKVPVSVGDRLIAAKPVAKYRLGQRFVVAEVSPVHVMLCPEYATSLGLPEQFDNTQLASFVMSCSADTDRLSRLEAHDELRIVSGVVLATGKREIDLYDADGDVIGSGSSLREAVDDSVGAVL